MRKHWEGHVALHTRRKVTYWGETVRTEVVKIPNMARLLAFFSNSMQQKENRGIWHPQTERKQHWCRCQQQNQSFYSASAHDHSMFELISESEWTVNKPQKLKIKK